MNTGSALARFTITLSQAVTEPVQVEWFTSDGTAKAGVDYAANKGTVVFAPGETAKTVDILVYGRAVGSEDRSFYVEMLPPTNAILGASVGECIITVDTSGSTPVTQIIVPTGPVGPQGKGAYQSYLDTTTDNPPKTEAEWVESLKGDPAEIALEVAPLIDVGDTVLTAQGTDTLGHPDSTTVKAVARRVAYSSPAKIATVVLADGDNTITAAALTGDAVNFAGAGFYPRIWNGTTLSSPKWKLNPNGSITVYGATAGNVLYATQYDLISDYNSRESVLSVAEPAFYTKHKSFEKGSLEIKTSYDALLWENAPVGQGPFYVWQGSFPKEVAAGSTPASTGGIADGAWKDVGNADLRSAIDDADGFKLIPSIARILSYVPVEQFRAPGLTDQQIVQAANNAAAASGRKVIFEAGKEYEIETVTVTAPWEGLSKLKRKPGTTADMIIVSNNGSLKSLTIDGRADTVSVAANTVYIMASTRFDIDGIKVTNTPGHAITGVGLPDTFAPSRIMNCEVDGDPNPSAQASTGSGIYLYNAKNVDVLNNKTSRKNGGILAQGNNRNVAKLRISGNQVSNNHGGGLSLVLISEAADQQAYEKIFITENKVFGNGGTGIAAQCDLSIVEKNIVYANGSQTYHQGILVNANGVTVGSNIITDNAGVGIDFGDCRKCAAAANIIEGNGWIGIEVNSCEQMTVTGNILNANFKGKAGADLQAGILVHKGNGGYPFLGDSKDITITGNAIRGGDGQQYAILIADSNCYSITVVGNACKNAGLLDDIVTRSNNVRIHSNDTRWDPLGLARVTISSGTINIPSVADVVSINGSTSVVNVQIADGGAFVKDRTVRLRAETGFTLENSGGTSGNLFIGSSKILAAGETVRIWSDGSGGWRLA